MINQLLNSINYLSKDEFVGSALPKVVGFSGFHARRKLIGWVRINRKIMRNENFYLIFSLIKD